MSVDCFVPRNDVVFNSFILSTLHFTSGKRSSIKNCDSDKKRNRDGLLSNTIGYEPGIVEFLFGVLAGRLFLPRAALCLQGVIQIKVLFSDFRFATMQKNRLYLIAPQTFSSLNFLLNILHIQILLPKFAADFNLEK